MIPSKVNLKEFFSKICTIYVDSTDKLLWSDISFFYILPIFIGILFSVLVSPLAKIDIIYTSVAFLSGFVFSAFVLLLNILPLIKQSEDGPKKEALELNVKEITLISLLVFFVGLMVLLIGLLDLIFSNGKIECLNNFVIYVRGFAVAGFVCMILHMVMLAKRLFVTLIST